MVLPLDLAQFETHVKLVDEVVSQFGKVIMSYPLTFGDNIVKQIDILVNNGGRSQRALAVDTSLDVQRSLLELNTLGTISLTQPVVKQMQKQKDGLIVVVSSVAGKIGKSCM